MKISATIIIIVILFSCKEKALMNHHSFIHGYEVITNVETGLRLYFKNNEIIKCDDSLMRFQYHFHDGNINIIDSISFINNSLLVSAELRFDTTQNKETLTLYSETNDENIWEYYNDNKTTTEVYSFIPSPITGGVLTSSFEVLNGDTTNYFYYKQNALGYEIMTDLKRYKYDTNILDSVLIKYANISDTITFYSPVEGICMPLFNGAKIYTEKNTSIIPFSENALVGDYYVAPKDKSSGYFYKFLYFKGDIITRIRKKKSELNRHFLKLSGNTIENTEFLKKIIKTGLYKIENGIIIKTQVLPQ